MVQKRVIAFSSHNIYTEGVVSRLRQHPAGGDFHFIDAGQDDFVAQIVRLSPDVVILDQDERCESQCCLLCELLSALPSITIIRLKVQEKDVQVISSTPHDLKGVVDLINLIWREER